MIVQDKRPRLVRAQGRSHGRSLTVSVARNADGAGREIARINTTFAAAIAAIIHNAYRKLNNPILNTSSWDLGISSQDRQTESDLAAPLLPSRLG